MSGTALQPTEKQIKAKADLIIAYTVANNLGIDADEVIVDERGKRKKLDAQIRILTWAGLSLVVAPYCYYGLKFVAAWQHIPYDFPEADFNKFEFFNLGAVMAYGFSSGIRALIKHKRETAIDAIHQGLQASVFDGALSMPPTQLLCIERNGRADQEDSDPSD